MFYKYIKIRKIRSIDFEFYIFIGKGIVFIFVIGDKIFF